MLRGRTATERAVEKVFDRRPSGVFRGVCHASAPHSLRCSVRAAKMTNRDDSESLLILGVGSLYTRSGPSLNEIFSGCLCGKLIQQEMERLAQQVPRILFGSVGREFPFEGEHGVAMDDAPGSPDQRLLAAGVRSRMKVLRRFFQQEICLGGGVFHFRVVCFDDPALPHHLEVRAVAVRRSRHRPHPSPPGASPCHRGGSGPRAQAHRETWQILRLRFPPARPLYL